MPRQLAALTCALAISAAMPGAQAPSAPPAAGIARTVLLDNGMVSVARVRFAPGARDTVHTHPFTLAIVRMTRGDQGFLRDGTLTREVLEAGAVELVEPGVPHAAANVGMTEWDVIAVGGKRAEPDLVVLGSTLLTPARPDLAPGASTGARVIIPLSVARLRVQIGGETTTELYAAGEPIFVPRDTAFALRSTGTAPVLVVSLLVR
jgi:quercetin dioxygenase-like cupin family protein